MRGTHIKTFDSGCAGGVFGIVADRVGPFGLAFEVFVVVVGVDLGREEGTVPARLWMLVLVLLRERVWL